MKIRKEIKVGVVFVLATAILIWGLMFLKGLELLKPSRTFYAVYDQVNGLVAANPVSIKGLKVGQVKKLYFDTKNPKNIIVELYILGDYPIAKNSSARIFSSSLLGAPIRVEQTRLRRRRFPALYRGKIHPPGRSAIHRRASDAPRSRSYP